MEEKRNPPSQRVNNAIGLVSQGNYGHQTVFVIDVPSFRNLADLSDLWVLAGDRAPHIILAMAELRAENGGYHVDQAFARSGYAPMLRNALSDIARRNNITQLDFLGAHVRPRHWSPFQGVRRRGQKAVNAVQRQHELTCEDIEKLFVKLKMSFQDFLDRTRRVQK